MNRVSTAAVALTALLILSTGAQAAPMYDFSLASPPPGGVVQLGPNETFSGLLGDITASAFYLNGTTWTTSELIARNVTNDNGLGNCSPNEVCDGDGNRNELSQLTNNEAILLARPDNTSWSALYLSSLDNNDGSTTQGLENGTFYWGDDISNNFATLINPVNSFSFSFGAFGAGVEGELLLTGIPDSFATARYLLFVPGGIVPENNDYLVWGATLRESRNGEGDVPAVPEPASLVLLGSGLVALARKRRRDGRR
jgi:hypothetical protein